MKKLFIKNKKLLKFILKLLVSLVFLFWVIFSVNWKEVAHYLREANILLIFMFVLIYFMGIVISAWKWKVIAEFKGVRLGFKEFFKYYFAGTFVNNFMPSFIGGDAFRGYQIGKKDGKYVQAFSSIFADRITGLMGASILCLIFSLIDYKLIFENRVLLLIDILIMFFLLTDILTIWIRNYFHGREFRLLNFMPETIKHFISEVGEYSRDYSIIIKSIFYSMLFSFVGVALANYMLFISLGIKISFIKYLSLIFIISIISSIPVSINNIGIKEWAYITFFGFLGISSSAVVSVAILSRFLQMALSFFSLPIYLEGRKK